MKLTGKMLAELELTLGAFLTVEQTLIILHRFKHEPRYGWDVDDFVCGIYEVIAQYPDHRNEVIAQYPERKNKAIAQYLDYRNKYKQTPNFPMKTLPKNDVL